MNFIEKCWLCTLYSYLNKKIELLKLVDAYLHRVALYFINCCMQQKLLTYNKPERYCFNEVFSRVDQSMYMDIL